MQFINLLHETHLGIEVCVLHLWYHTVPLRWLLEEMQLFS